MVRDREKLSSVLDSAPQKSISLAKSFKKVFNNCKNAGLCYLGSIVHVTALRKKFVIYQTLQAKEIDQYLLDF
jgi:hypothetical protein